MNIRYIYNGIKTKPGYDIVEIKRNGKASIVGTVATHSFKEIYGEFIPEQQNEGLNVILENGMLYTGAIIAVKIDDALCVFNRHFKGITRLVQKNKSCYLQTAGRHSFEELQTNAIYEIEPHHSLLKSI